MADDSMTGHQDPFFYKELFPDAGRILKHPYKPQQEILTSAVFVLDANCLLVPYGLKADSIADLKHIYEGLVKADRIAIPAHALREFAVHRPVKMRDMLVQLERAGSLNDGDISYPMLEQIPGYTELKAAQEKLQTAIRDFQKKLANVKDVVRKWHWDDPVSKLYRDVFPADRVIDTTLKDEQLLIDFERRAAQGIPPGIKDADKTVNSVGDLVIWHSMKAFAKAHKKGVIFVSNDSKGDWFHRGNKAAYFPRSELLDEFYRDTERQQFMIIDFAAFLTVNRAKPATITEAKNAEVRDSITMDYDRFTRSLILALNRLRTIVSSRWVDNKRLAYPSVHKEIERCKNAASRCRLHRNETTRLRMLLTMLQDQLHFIDSLAKEHMEGVDIGGTFDEMRRIYTDIWAIHDNFITRTPATTLGSDTDNEAE